MAKGVKKPLREWRVSLIGAKSKYIGRVVAADAESAIDKAMEEFRTDAAGLGSGLRNRLLLDRRMSRTARRSNCADRRHDEVIPHRFSPGP
jgi:hypothetical protein